MTKRHLIPILFAGLLGSIPACGDDGGGGGGGGGGGTITVAQLANGAADASCAKEFDCCTADERTQDFSFFTNADGSPITTEAQCDTVYEGFIGAILTAQINDSVAKHRLAFDGAKAGACLAAIQGLSCTELANEAALATDHCSAFITPLVEIGGACQQNNECKNSFCDGAQSADGSDAAVDGACTAFPALGASCTGGDGTCAKGQFCGESATDGQVCQATLADGMDCQDDDSCTTGNCSNDGVCGADTRCLGN